MLSRGNGYDFFSIFFDPSNNEKNVLCFFSDSHTDAYKTFQTDPI